MDNNTLELIIIVFAVIQIVMIIKFFGIAANIADIRNLLQEINKRSKMNDTPKPTSETNNNENQDKINR